MAEPQSQPKRQQSFFYDLRTGFLTWRTRDILMLVVVSIVFGLLLIGANYAPLLTVIFGPVAQWLWNGLWLIAPIFTAYVIRRPGAAFLTSILIELVMLPFVPNGILGLIRGVMYGVCIELAVMLWTRYRTYSLVRILETGACSGVFIFLSTGAIAPLLLGFSFASYEPLVVIGILLTLTFSCTVGSLIAKLLVDMVARTGVLSGTALGRKEVVEI